MSITTIKTKYKVRYSLFSYSIWIYLEVPRQYTFESNLSIKLFPETFKWGEKTHTDMMWYFTIDFSQSRTDKSRKCVEHQHSFLAFWQKKYEQLPQDLPTTNMNIFCHRALPIIMNITLILRKSLQLK